MKGNLKIFSIAVLASLYLCSCKKTPTPAQHTLSYYLAKMGGIRFWRGANVYKYYNSGPPNDTSINIADTFQINGGDSVIDFLYVIPAVKRSLALHHGMIQQYFLVTSVI